MYAVCFFFALFCVFKIFYSDQIELLAIKNYELLFKI